MRRSQFRLPECQFEKLIFSKLVLVTEIFLTFLGSGFHKTSLVFKDPKLIFESVHFYKEKITSLVYHPVYRCVRVGAAEPTRVDSDLRLKTSLHRKNTITKKTCYFYLYRYFFLLIACLLWAHNYY